MIIKQLSVFIENKKGRLADVMSVLAEHDIDISAVSLADTADYGILRLIVNRPQEARLALAQSGVAVKVTDVVALVMDDAPGSAAHAIGLLARSDIAVEYMYACIGLVGGKALMVMRVEDVEKTERVLAENGFASLRPEDVYRI